MCIIFLPLWTDLNFLRESRESIKENRALFSHLKPLRKFSDHQELHLCCSACFPVDIEMYVGSQRKDRTRQQFFPISSFTVSTMVEGGKEKEDRSLLPGGQTTNTVPGTTRLKKENVKVCILYCFQSLQAIHCGSPGNWFSVSQLHILHYNLMNFFIFFPMCSQFDGFK